MEIRTHKSNKLCNRVSVWLISVVQPIEKFQINWLLSEKKIAPKLSKYSDGN